MTPLRELLADLRYQADAWADRAAQADNAQVGHAFRTVAHQLRTICDAVDADNACLLSEVGGTTESQRSQGDHG